MPIHDKETSAFLHEPSLARLISIDPNDTVNPDQDIKPMFKYVISLSWRGQSVRETMANVYNPSGKLCGSITMHRLRILYSAFRRSKLHQPEIHKQYSHPDFPTAIARLLNRYTNKATNGSKRSKLANQCTNPFGRTGQSPQPITRYDRVRHGIPRCVSPWRVQAVTGCLLLPSILREQGTRCTQ